MDIARVENLLVALDCHLTSKRIVACWHTLQSSQLVKVKQLTHWVTIEYYLSDGGYSRVWLDPFEALVFLGSNSREQVKAKWQDKQVQSIVTTLTELFRTARIEAEKEIANG